MKRLFKQLKLLNSTVKEDNQKEKQTEIRNEEWIVELDDPDNYFWTWCKNDYKIN